MLGSSPLPDAWKAKYEVIKDLNREWITVGEDNRYVPYIEKSMADVPVVGVSLDLSRYTGNQLLVCMPANSTLLVGKKISDYRALASCVSLDIDSLQQVNGQSKLFISVYQPLKNFEEVGLWVVQELTAVQARAANLVSERNFSLLNDFFVIGLLILLILYAILINQYPKIFRNLYSLSRVFSLKVREENSRIRLINEAHVLFLVHHCILLGFLFIVLVSTTQLLSPELPFLNFQPASFGEYMLLWAKISVLAFGIIWAKYIIVMLFGTLFKLRQLRYLHMLDFMRMSLIFGAIIFSLLIVVFAGVGYSASYYFNLLIYLFVGLAGIRVIILYFRLFSNASFRNIYLISYLCVAEVIPLLVSLELLVI
jgi:hypothetical protein